MPIIESLLDQDYYKLTMLQCILHQFPHCNTRYKFVCRNSGIIWPNGFIEKFADEIDNLCSLTFKEDELQYIATKPYFKPDFIEFLRMFKLNRKNISFGMKNGELFIETNGSFLQNTNFEIYVLSIVNELYFDMTYPNKEELLKEGQKRLNEKFDFIKEYCHDDFLISDFGTRRRFSKEWHKHVVESFVKYVPNNFCGTSNVLLAKELNITPIGTMAHEIFCVAQQLTRVMDSQKYTLQKWADEYRGNLGVALTDTFGIDVFLKDFDLYFAKLFSGLRHDSGSPYEFAEKVLKHYKDLKIDPLTKSLTFSDSLTVKSAFDIYSRYRGLIKLYFGIGTSISNDVSVNPLNIVFKVVECNGQPVAKISDGKGKTMCENQEYVNYLKSVFKIS
jgi:nicotinate phosphoribosyltransferase